MYAFVLRTMLKKKKKFSYAHFANWKIKVHDFLSNWPMAIWLREKAT